MLNEMAVASVIAAATAMGVGGAAWLLMFRPLGQLAPAAATLPAPVQVPHRVTAIDWSGKA